MMELLDKTTIRHYLLGNLSELERDEFEQEWFGGKAKYFALCEAENNLIDEYVRGQLSDEEHKLFERHFLSIATRHERVAIAKSLIQEIDRQAVRNPAPTLWERLSVFLVNFKPLPAFAISVSLLLLAFGFWFFRQPIESPIQIAKTETPTPPTQGQQPIPAEIFEPKFKASSPKPVVASSKSASDTKEVLAEIPLTMLLRDEGSSSLPILNLRQAFAEVKLKIPLPANDYQRFDATLQTAEGKEIKHWNAIKARKTKNRTGSFLEIKAILTKIDDYILIINGINKSGEAEEFRRLPFQVRK